MTDFRTLCAELLADYDNCHYRSELSDRARAALAQPEPARQPTFSELLMPPPRTALAQPETVVPTDDELLELMPQQMRDDLANAARALAGFDRANVKAAGAMRIILNRQAVNHARAVLARWGTPANTINQED